MCAYICMCVLICVVLSVIVGVCSMQKLGVLYANVGMCCMQLLGVLYANIILLFVLCDNEYITKEMRDNFFSIPSLRKHRFQYVYVYVDVCVCICIFLLLICTLLRYFTCGTVTTPSSSRNVRNYVLCSTWFFFLIIFLNSVFNFSSAPKFALQICLLFLEHSKYLTLQIKLKTSLH